MISAGEFRNGVTMEFEGDPYVVLEFQHVKPGKGAAFVRTKIKNLKTGAVLEKTFRPTEKMPRAHIDRQDMQYLYSDGDLFHFMNAETFDQIAVNSADVGDSLKFVKENEVVKILAYDGQVFGIEPPLFVELEITETEPAIPHRAQQSLPSWKQARRFRYLCSSTRVRLSKSTHVQANIWAE